VRERDAVRQTGVSSPDSDNAAAKFVGKTETSREDTKDGGFLVIKMDGVDQEY
jgi:hypothetical protein